MKWATGGVRMFGRSLQYHSNNYARSSSRRGAAGAMPAADLECVADLQAA